MKQTSHSNAKPELKDFVQIAIFIGFVYYFWPQINSSYNYFFQDNSPVTLAPDALGGSILPIIISTSQTNELRFKSNYVGKQFWTTGLFKEANKDFAKYHIAVEVGIYEVACETTNDMTLKVVSTLSAGDAVRIYGVIDDTWIGTLQLRQCAVLR